MSHEDEQFLGEQLVSIVDVYVSYVAGTRPYLIYQRLQCIPLFCMRLQCFPDIRNLNDLGQIRNFFQELMSFGQVLKVFFKVPNEQFMSNFIPNPNPNQVVVTFIDFLILMVEAILRFEEVSIACVKGAIQDLRTELGFLVAFLGDKGMHLQPNKNIVIDIETVVNEVGSFLYSFLFTIVVFIQIEKHGTSNEMVGIEYVVNKVTSFLYSDIFTFLEDIPLQTTVVGGRKTRKQKKKKRKRKIKQKKKAITNITALVLEVRSLLDFFVPTKNDQIRESGMFDLALSNLFPNFEILKTKIKEHCTPASNMSSEMDPKTTVVSLFIVDSVLVDLTRLLNNKSDRIVAVKDQIVMLHDELMLLGSSVMDIAVQQEAEHEQLLVPTRDVAYEVEYVINLFPHVWYLTLRLPQLIEKIQLIKTAVEETRNDINAAGVTEVAKYPGEQVLLPSKEPPILEDVVVGFDNVAIEIKEQLVRGKKQLQIISICGMPGLGKTTLANKLYTDPSVIYHFDKLGYCVVSQTYNKKNVLIDILSSIKTQKRETIMNMDEEKLVDSLYKSLKGRRYLIVMDDIWDTQSWDELTRYLPDDETGSRILFTTRNKEVGSNASSHTFIHALPFLSKVECWELLQLKVFKGKSCPQELLDIGKQIASNCHGLPLAVVVIAAILANKEKKENLWQQVAINSSLYISENPENCIRILELSYKHLPMHLKPCFLYFGAFNEDMEIPVRKLIMLWIAEGYIKKEEQKCLEDVALKYLVELTDRSLILVEKRRPDGRVKTCKIHDLLHEMCLRIAEENNFLKVVKLNFNDLTPFISQALVYQKHPCVTIYNRDFEQPKLFSCSFNVVTFLDYSDNSCHSDLIGIGIGHLVHLRYLAIAEGIFCSVLPSIESFYKLEFLYVNNQFELEIPDVLLSMACLRHVHFRGGAYFSSYLRGYNTFKITNLQSFSVLVFDNKIAERLLRCSPNLRRLKVKFDFSYNNSLYFLNHLESLKIYAQRTWRVPYNIPISLPINLKKLTLVRFEAFPEQMEIVGRMQYLEVLKLEDVEFKGDQWDISEDEFLQLKFLKLDGIQIAEWNVSGDPFPRLERLVLHYCRWLKMIPSTFGDILTLEKIEVYRCGEAIKESAKKIQEDQQDIGNEVLKVIILD